MLCFQVCQLLLSRRTFCKNENIQILGLFRKRRIPGDQDRCIRRKPCGLLDAVRKGRLDRT